MRTRFGDFRPRDGSPVGNFRFLATALAEAFVGVKINVPLGVSRVVTSVTFGEWTIFVSGSLGGADVSIFNFLVTFGSALVTLAFLSRLTVTPPLDVAVDPERDIEGVGASIKLDVSRIDFIFLSKSRAASSP